MTSAVLTNAAAACVCCTHPRGFICVFHGHFCTINSRCSRRYQAEYPQRLAALRPEDDLEHMLDLLMFKVPLPLPLRCCRRRPSHASHVIDTQVTMSQEAAALEASSLLALSFFTLTDASAPCVMHRMNVTYSGSPQSHCSACVRAPSRPSPQTASQSAAATAAPRPSSSCKHTHHLHLCRHS